MRKINNFFFLLDEGEKLHISDAIWFYGSLSLFMLIALVVML